MSLIALLILGLAVVPAFGLAVLGWLALDDDPDEADDMRGLVGLVGFEGVQLET